MKPKSNYTRVMAGFYIFLCLIASLILGEIIWKRSAKNWIASPETYWNTGRKSEM